MSCRMCKSKSLELVLDLGFHPPSDAFLKPEELDQPETRYPLRVVVCRGCGLWQLDYVVDPKILYQKDYPYESSMTATGREHFREMAENICRDFSVGAGALAIDIGSNVGVLLEKFKTRGLRVLGVDPASISSAAILRGVETIPDFFTASLAQEIKRTRGEAAVVTGTNVFAHIDDLDDVLEGIRLLLSPRGVFVIEAPHLLRLVEKIEYDTIYHEHLSYLAVKPMARFVAEHGLELFDVAARQIHGGTLRYFIARPGEHTVQSSVAEFIRAEEAEHLFEPNHMRQTFGGRVAHQRRELLALLTNLKAQGKRIAGVSAPAKGSTLLNYCGIGPEHLDYVTEKSAQKIGRFIPGSHIRIEPDETLIRDMPDYALILAWNFAPEIMKNLDEYRKAGGKFIIPIPSPVIV
ncbi:MAG: class I SAM-dependent methyltransferase [Candidatus Sungbacteria bacterium]|nr:class I SAM-dependent methyltransferase [Candidatus Sungbacteria bacterium]